MGNQEQLYQFCQPTWFIVALFSIKCMCCILGGKQYLGAVIALIIFMLCRKSGWVSPEHDYFQIMTGLLCLPFFVVGFYVRKLGLLEKYDRHLSKASSMILNFLIFALCMWLANYNISHASFTTYGNINVFRCATGYNLGLFIVIASLSSLSILQLCRLLYGNKSFKVVSIISSGTILILCLHNLFLWIFSVIVGFNPILALIVSFSIIPLFSVPIVFCNKYFPVLMGRRNVFE